MPHYLFVTGRLAETPLRRVLEGIAPQVGFEYSVAVMPITIAALITPRWLARRLEVPEGVDGVMVPGHCEGDLSALEDAAGVPVLRGPRDLRELPEFYGGTAEHPGYGNWDIEILAWIRRADELPVDEILDRATDLADEGADLVLLEGSGRPWPTLGELVEELREEERRVAVANVPPLDLLAAIPTGIDLVFPADEEQEEAAAGAGCEVVVQGAGASDDDLAKKVDKAIRRGTPFRIDSGLEPIGLGLAESVTRYRAVRRRWPQVRLTMALDRVTETTAVDSAPLHTLLVGLCQELRVGSVVVGQDKAWTRSAVRECHATRQVSCWVATSKTPAQEVEPGLLMLRDGSALEFGREELDRLAEVLKDPSPRLYAEGGRLHAVSAGKHLESDDPYDLFDQIQATSDRAFDAERAFYLGYEMAKAMTALTLGKTYRQDEALGWGMLTRRELTRLERRALRLARSRDGGCEEARQYFEEDEFEGPLGESPE